MLLTFLRQPIATEEQIVHGWKHIVGAVMLHQFLLLFVRKPIALALVQFRFQLGEQLLVLQRCTIYLPRQLHTEEATTSSRVGEQILAVTGANERGHTGQVAVLHPVGLTIMQLSHLNQVLQQWLLVGGQLVVFIQLKKLV